MDISKLATDKALETNGVWVQFDDDSKFLVASLRSKAYRTIYQRELGEMRRKSKKPTSDQSEDMLMRCYSEAILLNWQGVTEKGAVLPATVDNKLRVIQTCPTVWDFLVNTANTHETFHKEEVEEAKAQLGEVSPGN